MKRWGLAVAGLYVLALLALTVPVCMAAFAPDLGLASAAEVFLHWPYWVWLVVMLLCQAALLKVPVQISMSRPVSRRSLLLPLVVSGCLIGALVVGALLSIWEFVLRDHAGDNWFGWAFLAAGVFIWAFWTVAFYRATAAADPKDVIARQCRLLLKGSILELLIAVPTHIVARSRNYCCAGFLTFTGLTFGLAVMLFSFDPAILFLYAARWRRLHPPRTDAS